LTLILIPHVNRQEVYAGDRIMESVYYDEKLTMEE
jgi:hypothetical protein